MFLSKLAYLGPFTIQAIAFTLYTALAYMFENTDAAMNMGALYMAIGVIICGTELFWWF
jgi:hypothetical protein